MTSEHLLQSLAPTDNPAYLDHTNYHLFPGGRKKLAFIVEVLKKLLQQGPLTILDIGCGNGSITFPVGSLGYDTVGIDISEESIRFAQSKNTFSNVRFTRHDLTAAPLPQHFSCVICSEVLEHLDHPEELLRAIARVAAPGASLLITVPNGYGLREIGGRAEKQLRPIPGMPRLIEGIRRSLGMHSESEKHQMHTSNPDQGHVQKFTPSSLTRLLNSHGLEIVQWVNSFWLLSLFGKAKTGICPLARFDSWLADKLPRACASGWYVWCRYRQ